MSFSFSSRRFQYKVGNILPPQYSILFIILSALLLGLNLDNSVDNVEAIQETIKVGLDVDYAPQEFFEDGKPKGYNIDLMKIVADEMDVEVEWYPMEWDDILNALKNGEIDVISAVNSQDRRNFFDFSEPILNLSQNIFVRNESFGITSLDDLNGSKIGVQQGDIGHEFLLNQEHLNLEIIPYPDQKDCLKQLFSGDVDAVFGNSYTLHYYIHELDYEESIMKIGVNYDLGKYCYAVKKGDSELLGLINQTLLELKDSGKFQENYNKWFGEHYIDLEPEEIREIFITYIIPTIVVAISLISAIAFWNRSLKKKIEKATVELEEKKQLIQKQDRIESIGYLAGGIAHDFNNFLAEIMGNLEIAKFEIEDNSDPKQLIQIIEETKGAVERAKSLSYQLLTFSKGGEPVRKTLNVVPLVKEIGSLATSGSEIICNYHIEEKLWPIYADKDQIAQVLNNLIINAVQAMENGGAIDIYVKNEHSLPKNERSPLILQGEKYVKIIIQDEGKGIAEEDLEKVFDPYYTTKEKGFGLGLSVAFSIIQKHNGHIEVSSKKEKGTTFTIFLPIPERNLEDSRELESPDMDRIKITNKIENIPNKKNRTRVLIMDDDISILINLMKFLKKLGFDPIPATKGEDAMALIKIHQQIGKPIHIVVLDLTIKGGIGGNEVIKNIKKSHNDVFAIVSSGYSEGGIMSDYKDHGFDMVLKKPYDFKKLEDIFLHLKN